MDRQTQDYISLKPIFDRFKEVAMTISDAEIKSIIKEELKEQLRSQVEFGSIIGGLVDEWLESNENCDFVMKCIKESVSSKFSK